MIGPPGLLPLLTCRRQSHASGKSLVATRLSAPQRRDLRADTTARDAATKPPRDSASPDAAMKRQPYLQSEALVSEAVSAGRALSVCGAVAGRRSRHGTLHRVRRQFCVVRLYIFRPPQTLESALRYHRTPEMVYPLARGGRLQCEHCCVSAAQRGGERGDPAQRLRHEGRHERADAEATASHLP